MSSVLMRNYIDLVEQKEFEARIAELFEEKVKKSFDPNNNMLAEGLFTASNAIRVAIMGFIKIVQILWRMGWYAVTHPFKAAKYAVAGVAAHAINPFVQKVYITVQYAQKKAQQGADLFANLPALPQVDTSAKNWFGSRPGWLGGQNNAYNKAEVFYNNFGEFFTWFVDMFKEAKNMFFGSELSAEQKATLLKEWGISDTPYADAMMAALDFATKFGIDNFWVILAASIPFVAAARFKSVGKLVDSALQGKLENVKSSITGRQQLAAPSSDETPKISDDSKTINVQATEKGSSEKP